MLFGWEETAAGAEGDEVAMAHTSPEATEALGEGAGRKDQGPALRGRRSSSGEERLRSRHSHSALTLVQAAWLPNSTWSL